MAKAIRGMAAWAERGAIEVRTSAPCDASRFSVPPTSSVLRAAADGAMSISTAHHQRSLKLVWFSTRKASDFVNLHRYHVLHL